MTFPSNRAVNLVEPKHLDEETRELVALGGKRAGSFREVRIVSEQRRVMHPQHPGARPRRGNHIVEALESLDHRSRNRLGIFPVAGIVGRLSAAGLALGHFHPCAGILEQLDRGKAHARPEQIHETGDEEPDMRPLLGCFRRHFRPDG